MLYQEGEAPRQGRAALGLWEMIPVSVKKTDPFAQAPFGGMIATPDERQELQRWLRSSISTSKQHKRGELAKMIALLLHQR